MMRHLETNVHGEAVAPPISTPLCTIALCYFLHGMFPNLKLSSLLLVSVLIWNTFGVPKFGINPMRKESPSFLFNTIFQVFQNSALHLRGAQ